jgi:hypothetical protein
MGASPKGGGVRKAVAKVAKGMTPARSPKENSLSKAKAAAQAKKPKDSEKNAGITVEKMAMVTSPKVQQTATLKTTPAAKKQKTAPLELALVVMPELATYLVSSPSL